MSTLPKKAPFIKRFLNGDWGWSHATQEFGVWAVLIGFVGWKISPIFALLIIVILLKFADEYWRKREVQQSLDMGRRGDALDMSEVPKYPTKFWTKDAIADVMFPRKMRKVWLVLSLSYLVWMFSQVGLLGVWFR